MKLSIKFFGALSFLVLSIGAMAIQCPNIQQLGAFTHCHQTGVKRYKCWIRTNDNRWVGEFMSEADVTTQPGTHELVGKQGESICSYKFITPTLEVDYQIFYKQEKEHSQKVTQHHRDILKK